MAQHKQVFSVSFPPRGCTGEEYFALELWVFHWSVTPGAWARSSGLQCWRPCSHWTGFFSGKYLFRLAQSRLLINPKVGLISRIPKADKLHVWSRFSDWMYQVLNTSTCLFTSYPSIDWLVVLHQAPSWSHFDYHFQKWAVKQKKNQRFRFQ